VLVIGKNLEGIVSQLKICEGRFVEEFSLKVTLDRKIRRMRSGTLGQHILYGHKIDHRSIYSDLESCDQNLELNPQDKVLACSVGTYKMPAGFFGLIQTKGTLARMFVSATCNDGQVEPGYEGKLTLEVVNFSNFRVDLPIGSEIAQLFIFQCSGETDKPYSGKYQGATTPTLPMFN
jgi:dCTP deaminase